LATRGSSADVGTPAGPELTVVICSLGEKPLSATVDSISASAKAAGRGVDVLVVWQGGGSPDVPEGVSVLEVFPLGISYARNRGADAVESRLVGYVDDDETIAEGWVAGALAEFAGDAADAPGGVFGPVLSTSPDDVPYFCPTKERVVYRGAGTPPWLVGTGGNMVFPREALLRAGGFDPRFGAGAPVGSAEETDLVLRLLGEGRRLVYTPELTVYHPARGPADEVRARRGYGVGMGSALRGRTPLLSVKYLGTIGQELGRSVRARNARRRREVLTTLRSFLAGLVVPVRMDSPVEALERLPAELRGELEPGALTPLPATVGEQGHLRYSLEGEGVLHLYVNPSTELPALLDENTRIVVRAASTDAVWALERR
jgi:hypothetical protein